MNSSIILNWNTTDLLIGMYESAVKLASKEMQFIIIDNGSRENEVHKLEKYFVDKTNVKIKKLPQNIGFAAGNNVALEMVEDTCDLVFFINSDIVIQEEAWDKKFEEVLENFKVDNVKIAGSAYHPLTWSRDARFKIQPLISFPVLSESVQGAFFAIPYKILKEQKEIDGHFFDEEFRFAHYEETDLQFRIMKRYKCVWFPCRHVHLHDKSSTKSNGYNLCKEIKNINDFKQNSERNRQRLLTKHKEFFEKK